MDADPSALIEEILTEYQKGNRQKLAAKKPTRQLPVAFSRGETRALLGPSTAAVVSVVSGGRPASASGVRLVSLDEILSQNADK